jgi:hypothetical protein
VSDPSRSSLAQRHVHQDGLLTMKSMQNSRIAGTGWCVERLPSRARSRAEGSSSSVREKEVAEACGAGGQLSVPAAPALKATIFGGRRACLAGA